MTNREIRRAARESLGGKLFGNTWLMALVVCLITLALSAIAGMTYVGILLTGCISYGASYIFLDVVRGKREIELSDCFAGFRRFTDTLVLGLLVALFTFLWALLFYIPGIVKAYSYSMAFYIMKDHPEYTARQCIDESRRIMCGNKMKLFLLDLSFIGWAIVCSFTCGIGYLWLYPYMQASRAEFYCSLVDGDKTAQAETAQAEEASDSEGAQA